MASHVLSALLALASIATAGSAPGYSGLSLQWQDNFSGNSGSSPNGANWGLVSGRPSSNNEMETYTTSTKNAQLSGGGTLQIVPWKDSSTSGGWTSARLESSYVFTPQNGQLTRIEASIRFGTNDPSTKEGIWPAFWMLGDSIRHGTSWPQCGELDILETIDGQLIGHGTAHCDVSSGGTCNEPNGIGSPIQLPDQSWHTWRLDIDRRSGLWTSDSITWSMDGHNFQTITGSRIGKHSVWQSLAESPLYIILNVAVGGDWPGPPNGQTKDGYGAMMEVSYVAHYHS